MVLVTISRSRRQLSDANFGCRFEFPSHFDHWSKYGKFTKLTHHWQSRPLPVTHRPRLLSSAGLENRPFGRPRHFPRRWRSSSTTTTPRLLLSVSRRRCCVDVVYRRPRGIDFLAVSTPTRRHSFRFVYTTTVCPCVRRVVRRPRLRLFPSARYSSGSANIIFRAEAVVARRRIAVVVVVVVTARARPDQALVRRWKRWRCATRADVEGVTTPPAKNFIDRPSVGGGGPGPDVKAAGGWRVENEKKKFTLLINNNNRTEQHTRRGNGKINKGPPPRYDEDDERACTPRRRAARLAQPDGRNTRVVSLVVVHANAFRASEKSVNTIITW